MKWLLYDSQRLSGSANRAVQKNLKQSRCNRYVGAYMEKQQTMTGLHGRMIR